MEDDLWTMVSNTHVPLNYRAREGGRQNMRRQLQTLYYASALRWEFTLRSKDIIHKKRKPLIICGTLRSHQLVNIKRSISGSDKPSLLNCT